FQPGPSLPVMTTTRIHIGQCHNRAKPGTVPVWRSTAGYSRSVALGLPSVMPGGAPSIGDLVRGPRPTFSFEFFPPRDTEMERQLWNAIRQLEPLRPSFVSITYGAGGSTRDNTVAATERVATETTLLPMAHLTAVNHSVAEL